MGANRGDAGGPLATAAVILATGGLAAQAAVPAAPAYIAVRGAQDAAKQGAEATKKMKDQSDQLLADADKRRLAQESSATQAAQRDAARNRVLAGSTSASGGQTGGYSSTILTSPLGVPNMGNSGGGAKTLLGS